MLSFKPLYGFRAKMMLEILHWGSPNLKVCEMADWTVYDTLNFEALNLKP